MGQSAREVALHCLMAGEKQGAWSDGYLRNAIRRAKLERRDAALCTRLAFGVLQNRMLLDWHIARLCTTPIDKLEPAVRDCLRLGAYQLLFLDRVPVHAAVNESVALSKRYSRSPRASALVNAVLRALDRAKEAGLCRPANLPPGTPGCGWRLFDCGGLQIAVVNLLGRVYMNMPALDCPFRTVQALLAEIRQHTPVILVDFHAEATSEKLALANFLDGRVTAVWGTHTHVQTNDARLLPRGTAYLTDVGMTGARDSILGVETEGVVERYLTGRPQPFLVARRRGINPAETPWTER